MFRRIPKSFTPCTVLRIVAMESAFELRTSRLSPTRRNFRTDRVGWGEHPRRGGCWMAAEGLAAEQLADMLLATMSGEIVTRALASGGADGAEGIKARAHAFFATVLRT